MTRPPILTRLVRIATKFAGLPLVEKPMGEIGQVEIQLEDLMESAIPAVEKRYSELLEVPIGASWAEVKESYRKLLNRYHPDRFSDNAEKQKVANNLVIQINEAYQFFLDKHERS